MSVCVWGGAWLGSARGEVFPGSCHNLHAHNNRKRKGGLMWVLENKRIKTNTLLWDFFSPDNKEQFNSWPVYKQ